mmetsp:Transcript_31567/g.98165  ORF Transcript_31567/g.98165 Transcript_31567/m.98165 type:complete len:294 (+) Transcript_31567:47-928(+)
MRACIERDPPPYSREGCGAVSVPPMHWKRLPATSGPLHAAMSPRNSSSDRRGWPSRSQTAPPASVTMSQPAATSQRLSPASRCASVEPRATWQSSRAADPWLRSVCTGCARSRRLRSSHRAKVAASREFTSKVTAARRSSPTGETCSRPRTLEKAPKPLAAQNVSPISGAATTASAVRGPSATARDTQQCGEPWMKFFVPSMGSRIQAQRPRSAASGSQWSWWPSSAMMASSGKAARTRATAAASTSLSMAVTGSVGSPPSGLSSYSDTRPAQRRMASAASAATESARRRRAA